MSTSLPRCRYGKFCYRKNPHHLQEFSHSPSENSLIKKTEAMMGKRQGNGNIGESLKRTKSDNSTNDPIIKLDGLHWTKISCLSDCWNEHTLSLSEILDAINPIYSIHFNFMIDVKWLLSQYSRSVSMNPITLVVGETGGTEMRDVQRQIFEQKIDNVQVVGARMPLPFGTHHTKMSIFESPINILHLLISTANLIERDWDRKTQGLFMCSATKICSNSESSSDFKNDLLEYLTVYLNSRNSAHIDKWITKIEEYDFSAIKARIVASTPGRHICNESTNLWGHLKVRKLISQLGFSKDDWPVVCQFSSIGSLGNHPDQWLSGQFMRSLTGVNSFARPSLIYPTVENVRNSLEGYLAGSSLPYQSKTADRQPYLRSMLHQWKSDKLGRTAAMPHVKSYARLCPDTGKLLWWILTSANLSKAAWGDMQKNGTQLMIRSYELGVFIKAEDIFGMDAAEWLPFDWPLTKYGHQDQSWIVDKHYTEVDVYGCKWPL